MVQGGDASRINEIKIDKNKGRGEGKETHPEK
jgi:hypothetical protein